MTFFMALLRMRHALFVTRALLGLDAEGIGLGRIANRAGRNHLDAVVPCRAGHGERQFDDPIAVDVIGGRNDRELGAGRGGGLADGQRERPLRRVKLQARADFAAALEDTDAASKNSLVTGSAHCPSRRPW